MARKVTCQELVDRAVKTGRVQLRYSQLLEANQLVIDQYESWLVGTEHCGDHAGRVNLAKVDGTWIRLGEEVVRKLARMLKVKVRDLEYFS